MRTRPFALPLIAALVVAGCDNWTGPLGAVAGVTIVSVATIQRTPGDLGVSIATGRDCSLVRLDRQQSYCAPKETAPKPPPYCTHSLGRVDCWIDPQDIRQTPAMVADTPPLTAEQELDRRKSWWQRELGLPF